MVECVPIVFVLERVEVLMFKRQIKGFREQRVDVFDLLVDRLHELHQRLKVRDLEDLSFVHFNHRQTHSEHQLDALRQEAVPNPVHEFKRKLVAKDRDEPL